MKSNANQGKSNKKSKSAGTGKRKPYKKPEEKEDFFGHWRHRLFNPDYPSYIFDSPIKLNIAKLVTIIPIIAALLSILNIFDYELAVIGPFESEADSASEIHICCGEKKTLSLEASDIGGSLPIPLELALNSLEIYGIGLSFSPEKIRIGETSKMTISVNESANPGRFPLTILGVGPLLQRENVHIDLCIEPKPHRYFSISSNPSTVYASFSMNNYTNIRVEGQGGYDDEVSLRAMDAPEGVNISFSRPIMRINARDRTNNSTCIIRIAENVIAKNYNIHIHGNGINGTNCTTNFSLIVESCERKKFNILARNDSISIGGGESASIPIIIKGNDGYSADIKLSSPTVIDGVTVSFDPIICKINESNPESISLARIDVDDNADAIKQAIRIIGKGNDSQKDEDEIVLSIDKKTEFHILMNSQSELVPGSSISVPVKISAPSEYTGVVHMNATSSSPLIAKLSSSDIEFRGGASNELPHNLEVNISILGDAMPGSDYDLTVSGYDKDDKPVYCSIMTLRVVPPSFNVDISPDQIEAKPLGNKDVIITIEQGNNGYTGEIRLSHDSYEGIDVEFNPTIVSLSPDVKTNISTATIKFNENYKMNIDKININCNGVCGIEKTLPLDLKNPSYLLEEMYVGDYKISDITGAYESGDGKYIDINLNPYDYMIKLSFEELNKKDINERTRLVIDGKLVNLAHRIDRMQFFVRNCSVEPGKAGEWIILGNPIDVRNMQEEQPIHETILIDDISKLMCSNELELKCEKIYPNDVKFSLDKASIE